MKRQYAVSLVVPVYNSAAIVATAISELTNFLKDSYLQYELVLVDDCSTDGTPRILEAAADKNDQIQLIFHTSNLGQQLTLADGIFNSQYEIVVTLDVDLPVEIHELLKLTDMAYSEAELVMGRRIGFRHPLWWRHWASNVANVFFRAIYPFQIDDFGSGVAAMRHDLIARLKARQRKIGLLKIDLLQEAASYAEIDVRIAANRPVSPSSYSLRKLIKLFGFMITSRFRQ